MFAEASIAVHGNNVSTGGYIGNAQQEQVQLVIKAVNNGPEAPYVHSVTWNGEDISNQGSIPYRTLMGGGELVFTMGRVPAAAAAG